jgi:hypothetical protein
MDYAEINNATLTDCGRCGGITPRVMAYPRGDGYTALGMAFDSLLPCRRRALDRLGDWLWNGYRTASSPTSTPQF